MPTKPDSIGPQGKALYMDGPNQAKRAQSFSSDGNLNEEKLKELGNKEVAEKKTTLTVSASVEYNNYGSMATIMQALGQGLWQNENNPARVVTDTDFNEAYVDILTHQSNDDANIDFAEWNGYMRLTSFAFAYPADGIATETYDYEGENRRWFLNDWKNATVYKADFVDSTTAIISGVNLESTNNPVLIEVNQSVVASLSTAGETITLTDNASDTNIAATDADGNVAFASGDRIRVIVSGTGSTYSTLPSTPAGIGGLSRGNVVAKLYNPVGNAEKTLRIQSLSIDGDLSVEGLPELGSKKLYARKLTRPININIAIEFNETDLEEYAKLGGNETAFDASTLREIDIEDLLRTNTLEIIEYKNETTQSFANELRRLKMVNVSVASDGDSGSVGDVATGRTFNLTTEGIIFSGSGVSPFL